MADQDISKVLARMARAGDVPSESGVVTPVRALRLSLARAVEGAAGLKVSVLSISEEAGVLDDLVSMVSNDDLILGLHGAKGLEGLAALDRELRSALVEAQTMGQLSAMPAPDRPVSVADVALATPVIDAFMIELVIAAAPTALAGWTASIKTGARIDGKRGTSLKLPEAGYRMFRLSVDLGVADREGTLIIALPPDRSTAAVPAEEKDWSGQLHKVVNAAPTKLTAVLHRLKVPLAYAEGLRAGDIVPLAGVTVSSVRLEGPDGSFAGTARLGQLGGMRAVRIEPPPPKEMRDHASTPMLPGDVAGWGGADEEDPNCGIDDQGLAGYGIGDDMDTYDGAAVEDDGGAQYGDQASQDGQDSYEPGYPAEDQGYDGHAMTGEEGYDPQGAGGDGAYDPDAYDPDTIDFAAAPMSFDEEPQ
ncbi:hypothetical protein [Roseisalinus antarcticus]|uniref:Surface presentation of antigens (SPOA) n=1 Tax=Roseisalinus antarcticus TaxID=254357 RepID=A0A1Y5RKR6_9RHOB|nr:hypothetical protein [Roseisalinus antarcticus]SLN19792.1 Surface presentation of antigens (SPOA) [Roseisalinus antarcticus]